MYIVNDSLQHHWLEELAGTSGRFGSLVAALLRLEPNGLGCILLMTACNIIGQGSLPELLGA